MAAFAAVWAFAGLSHRAPALAIAALVVGAVASAVMFFQSRAMLSASPGKTESQKLFWIIVAAELVAIEIVLNVAIKFHREASVLPAIATIVGVHFFPLARVFRAPIFILTGAAITLWGIAMLALSLYADVEMWTGLGVALILATTAFLRRRDAVAALRCPD